MLKELSDSLSAEQIELELKIELYAAGRQRRNRPPEERRGHHADIGAVVLMVQDVERDERDDERRRFFDAGPAERRVTEKGRTHECGKFSDSSSGRLRTYFGFLLRGSTRTLASP